MLWSRHAAPVEPTVAEIDAFMADIPASSDGSQKINWIMFLTMFADKMEGIAVRHHKPDRRCPLTFYT